MNTAKILRTAFLKETSDGCFFQFDKVTVQYWASICQPSLLNQKQCGMVSNKKVCRSVQSMLHYK